MKRLSIVFFLILSSLLITGCLAPATYQFGGNTIFVSSPAVKTSSEGSVLANVFLGVSGDISLPPKVATSHPEVKVGISMNDPRPSVEEELKTFLIKVDDLATEDSPQIIRRLEITLDAKPLKVTRGEGLDENFQINFQGKTLTFSEKKTLAIPVLGRDDPQKAPRIKGIVAKIVCNYSPTAPENSFYSFTKTDERVWRFPIKVSSSKPVELNSIDLQVESENFLWLGTGETFPSPMVEVDQSTSAGFGKNYFRIQNIIFSTEELLAPSANPEELLSQIPGVVSFLFRDQYREADIKFEGNEYTFKFFQSPEPQKEKRPTTWGFIRSRE